MRYWSELCNRSLEYNAVCPPEQVIIARPAEGSALYEEFKSKILTEAGEIFRTADRDMLVLHQGFASANDLVEFVETHPNAIAIFNNVTISAHFPLEGVPVTPTPLLSACYYHI